MNKEILKLIAGFRRFRSRYFDPESSYSLYRKLSSGQTPKTLMIACSDSRVDPAILSGASPGELFVVRNVANLVPPFESQGQFHGVSAAIEFAVLNLQVENIVVLGHRQCGGIRALMDDSVANQKAAEHSFVGRWVKIAEPARQRVLEAARRGEITTGPDQVEADVLCRLCEMHSIEISLANLKTFPFVQKAIQENRLSLHGVYFDLELGELFQFNEDTGAFVALSI